MATMIPDMPFEVQEGSREKEMFESLRNLPDDYFVFHSLTLVTNSKGVLYESETDFVIFHPNKGIICIEAKAGHIYCDTGVWYYGNNIQMNHGGPYKQAEINKWKLAKYFEQRGLSQIWRRCKTLHAVWFPSITKSELNQLQLPPDADKSITLTFESLTNIESDINRIFGLQLPSGVETNITKMESKKVLENVLCPSFDLVPSVASDLSIRMNAFNRMIKEQINILNFLEEQPFAVINGAAGTGKTMIALEKARRHAENGDKVLFLCFNKMLCDFFRLKYSNPNIDYYTLDGFACSFCNTPIADYVMLRDFLENSYIENNFAYKHVIIDEGQDFGQDRYEETEIIQTLGTIVLSEEIKGNFYIFYDKNQIVQGFKLPKYISESDCKLTLYKNCRNTENIAVTSLRSLGIDKKPIMNNLSIKGDSPRIFISDVVLKQVEFLDSTLNTLIDSKIKDIVILTSDSEERSILSQYCKNGIYNYKNENIKFTTYRKFKGLEADAVVIIDVSTKTMLDNSLNFYVGSSRARFYLSAICNMSEEDCSVVLKHFKKGSSKKPKKALAALLNSVLAL